jgi:hypothetical protein
MAKTPAFTIAGRSAHSYRSGSPLAVFLGWAGFLVLTGIAAACLAGCDPSTGADDPASGGGDSLRLSGCWSVLDTEYIEAGRPSYLSGTLTLSQQGSSLAGVIIWDGTSRASDSIAGRLKGDSLSLSLFRNGVSGSTLNGSMQNSARFILSSYRMGSGSRLSASRLVHCPDPNLPNPNPRLLPVQATQDSIGVSQVDSTSLQVFPSYAYFGDSDVVRFSQAYDTLTFTYRSYRDRTSMSKSINSMGFSLLTTPQGEKVIYGTVDPYYSDAIIISDSTDYSLNENVVIPGGLPKGKYRLVIRLRVGCYCIPAPSYFYAKEFTIE